MKKLFLTLVTLISFTNVFAQDAEPQYPIHVYAPVTCLNPSFGDLSELTYEDLSLKCGFSFKNKKTGKPVAINEDLVPGTVVVLSYSNFVDDDYKISSVELNGKPVSFKKGEYEFTVDDFEEFQVNVAKILYSYRQAGTFVSKYKATSDRDMYLFDGIYGNKVYGIATKDIEAGMPYIALDGDYIIDFDLASTPVETFGEHKGLYASNDNSTTVKSKDFLIFYGGVLCYPNSAGNTVPVGRAYINLKEATLDADPSVTTKAKSIMSFDDGTGIDNITLGDESNNGPAYTISGQRVSNPTKGLYIINGKKVLMK